MFNFFKKHIVYIAVMLAIVELVSCIVNTVGNECIFGFLFSFSFAVLIFFVDCMFINKGCITGKSVSVPLWFGGLGIIFCVLSFLKRDSGYTLISLVASTIFITEFLLIKFFDITEY
jgi:hypothetical protein